MPLDAPVTIAIFYGIICRIRNSLSRTTSGGRGLLVLTFPSIAMVVRYWLDSGMTNLLPFRAAFVRLSIVAYCPKIPCEGRHDDRVNQHEREEDGGRETNGRLDSEIDHLMCRSIIAHP